MLYEGTSQDMSEYVRNTSDGSPRYLWKKKKTPCILWIDILGVDILGRTRDSAQAVEGMQVQK